MRTKSIEPRPAFQAYLDRLLQRPAYRRFEEHSGKLLAQLNAAV
jgi:hypothetical protein